ELPLSPQSRGFQVWKDTSEVPIYLKVYIFNWTNPEELNEPNKKPNLVQVGPYTFREKRWKLNITFHPENDTVSYLQKRTWHFESSKSNGTLQDKVSQLNAIIVSAAYKMRYWSTIMQSSSGFLINHMRHDINFVRTVDEILFTGFQDELLTMGQIFASDGPQQYDKFGWFYKRNATTEFEGHKNMGTGAKDLSNLGLMKVWNYKDTTKFFDSPCNMVEGSAGEMWPPYRTTDDIKLFTPDICRPVIYEYTGNVNHKGIKGYKYSLGKKSLSNDTRRRYPHEQAKYFQSTTTTENFFDVDPTTLRPEDSQYDEDEINEGGCYCNGECTPMGLMNVSSCRYGAPGFISLPHFLNGDPSLVDAVVGIKPEKEKHGFDIILEPTTGVPLKIAARLQINLLLQKSKIVTMLNNVPTIYFPILWFEVVGGIPDVMLDDFRTFVSLPNMMKNTGLVLALVGTLILLGVAVTTYLNWNKTPQ
ncbi:hypothetical protein QAD02_000906, partial [Eretmocerus hayati]